MGVAARAARPRGRAAESPDDVRSRDAPWPLLDRGTNVSLPEIARYGWASAPAVPGAGGRLGAHAKSPLPEERYRAHRGAFWVEASSIPRCCVPARARWKAAAAAG